MVKFLMHPEQVSDLEPAMPNLGITREEAEAVVAYLKWMSAVDTNGFPIHFGRHPDAKLGGRHVSDPSSLRSGTSRPR